MEPGQCPQCGGSNLENSAHEAITSISDEPQRVCRDCGTLVDLDVRLHIGRGALDDLPRSGNRQSKLLGDESYTDFMSFSDEPDLKVVDCSKMEKCHLIFENCPELGTIKSVGTSVYDDPGSSGYAKVTLNSLPKKDIQLEGGIHTIEISSGYDTMTSGLGGGPIGSFMPLSTEEVARNARICINNPRKSEIDGVENVAIVFQGASNPEEVIVAEGSDVRFVGLMGGLGIKSLKVRCERGAARVSIQGMPDLESVEIVGSTQVLDIHLCPRIKSVHGNGNTLIITNQDRGDVPFVQLSGFWIKAPSRAISNPRGLEISELSSCKDLEHACFSSLSYISACEMEEELGVKITTAGKLSSLRSLHIPSFVDAMSENLDLVPRLIEWFSWLPLLQDHYYMMRILTALSLSGADPTDVSEVRSHVLYQNLNHFVFSPHYSEKFVTPRMVETGSSRIFPLEDGEEISTTMEALHHKAIVGNRQDWVDDPNPWNRPKNSFIPLDRIDLEMWVISGSEIQPGIPSIRESGWHRWKSGRDKIDVQIFFEWVSQVLPSLLSERSDTGCQDKMDALSSKIFEMASKAKSRSPHIMNEVYDMYDTIAFHLSQSMEYGSSCKDRFEARFAEHLGSDDTSDPGVKAAIAYGILQHDTGMSLKWKLMIKGLINDLPIGEATRLRAPSIGGSKVFKDGLAPRLDWPYVENWRLGNDRN